MRHDPAAHAARRRHGLRVAARTALALATLLVVAVPARATSATPSPGRAAHHGASRHALWYETSGFGLYLRTAAGRSRLLSKDEFTHPVWSPATHLLAYVTESGRSVVVTSVSATGKRRDRFACGCYGGVAWLGRTLVGFDKRTMLLRNVTRHTTRRTKVHGAHWLTGQFDTPAAPVAVLGRSLLVSATTEPPSASGGPETFFRVTRAGRATTVGQETTNAEVSSGVTDGHGDVAYESPELAGVCADYGGVSVLDTATGRLTSLTLPALDRPWGVTSLRYSGRALLVGLAPSPKACGTSGGTVTSRQNVAAYLYRRAGNRLVRTSRAVADQRRDGHQVATMSGAGTTDSYADFASATLTEAEQGHRSVVARRVDAFGWL